MFDEHYDPTLAGMTANVDPYYVDSNNTLHGTRCSEFIEGAVLNTNNLPCTQDQRGDWDPSCMFRPHENQHASESLLFASGIHSVSLELLLIYL